MSVKKKINKMEALSLMEPVMEAACDRCVYLCEAEADTDMDKICNVCPVEKRLKNLIYQMCEIEEPDKDLERMFFEFWREYPRKENRKKAFSIWMRMRPSTELFEVIMHAVRRQKQTDQWSRGFAPYASTWLNGERWQDLV